MTSSRLQDSIGFYFRIGRDPGLFGNILLVLRSPELVHVDIDVILLVLQVEFVLILRDWGFALLPLGEIQRLRQLLLFGRFRQFRVGRLSSLSLGSGDDLHRRFRYFHQLVAEVVKIGQLLLLALLNLLVGIDEEHDQVVDHFSFRLREANF